MSHLMMSGLGKTNGVGGFAGTTLLGAEIGNFDYGAGRHVLSAANALLDFRPGKTLYLSVDFAAAAGSNNELLVGCYSGAYSGGKGWVIERGASSNTLYLTLWSGSGYVALKTGTLLGVRQLAIKWQSSDNHVLVSVDGGTASDVGALSTPNTDSSCKTAIGSPITTGDLYADSLKTGSVACFGMVASELSDADLAAASNSMSGATPLNRFTLPSQYASPVVDFNAYRDWDGSAGTFATSGSSPITFTVTGAIAKTDTSEVYYATSAAMYHDNGLNVSETYAVRHNALARIRFTTSLRRLAIHQTCTIYGASYDTFASVGIFNGGAYSSVSTSYAANTSSCVDTLLPAGSSKTIDLVEGVQALVGGTVRGTYMTGIRLPTDAVIATAPAPANRVVVVGDSIMNGYVGNNGQSDNPIAKLRGLTSYGVTLLGWGSATSYEFTQSGARAAWVASIAAMLNGTNGNTLIWETMTNDYGLDAQTTANYASNLGAFLDDLKAAVPNLQVKILGAISRISPAAETANGFGSTLDAYRAAGSGLTSGRSWAKYINDKYIVTSGNYYTDGIHPATAGLTQLGYALWGMLDFAATDLASLGLALRADTGVTLNGSDASQWDDQSGNGHNYVQGTAALQPAFNATGINSEESIDPTVAGGERMGVGYAPSGAQSIFVVYKHSAVPSASSFQLLAVLADSSTPSGGAGSLILAANYATYENLSFTMGAPVSGASVGAAITHDTNPHFLLVTFDGVSVSTPSSYKVYLDGVEKTAISSASFISSLFGSEASIGSTSGGSYKFGGAYGETIVTTAVISQAYRAALFGYAANRYAINPS